MKFLILLSISTGITLLASTLQAQQFSVSGHVVAGGGGTSQGSGFAITGTIAQADAAPKLQNGCWSVAPGFWGAYAAVQTPGAPALRVSHLNPTTVRVAFMPDCTEWVLQWTTSLGTDTTPTAWTDDADTGLVLVGEELTRDFHVPSWGPRLFFRLRAAH